MPTTLMRRHSADRGKARRTPRRDTGSQSQGSADVRATVVRILGLVLDEGRSLSEALQPTTETCQPALLQELCYGVLRWYARLDAMATGLLEKPLRRKDRDIHLLILTGLYQLEYTRIPAHAALATTVASARTLGKPWATGLVNGVLRHYQRQPEQLRALADATDAGRLAFPQWLLARLRRAWPEHWQEIVTASNERPPMSLRVNRQRVSRDDYRTLLERKQIEAHDLAHCDQGLVLEQPRVVEKLPGFSEGLVSVQDGGAQLAAVLLAPQPGERILDACAAPGGKACHILELEPEITALTAIDCDPRRLQRVESNLRRLSLKARSLVGDAAAPSGDWGRESYDRILLDAPCSATGVIRRHPDIKWLRRESDIGPLAALQARMLDALWRLLSPGGTLMYCTCSLMPEENEQQIGAFLSRTADARERSLPADWGHSRPNGRQIFPGQEQMDGFYYARLEKQE